jgi:hypothetical protein
MRRLWIGFAAALVPLIASAGRSNAGAAASTPVVVELFTSEGCSDCPPADVVLQQLIDTQPVAGAEVIALGEHVDYWDQQGWKDRFSSTALTFRQRLYGARFALDSIYTPQIVVDGRRQLVGSDRGAAIKAIASAAAIAHARVQLEVEPLGVSLIAATVTVRDLSALARGDQADVIVVLTEDHLSSQVTRGENHGRTLTHAAVVRATTTIDRVSSGEWTLRGNMSIAPEWNRDELKLVALVQEQRSRAILGASAVALRTPRR